MRRVVVTVALKHLLDRPRQSGVSMLGIVLGVGFFLAVSALMQGSESDFIKRLVDNSPHITVQDGYRTASAQPAEAAFPHGAVEIHNATPQADPRGIRGYERVLAFFRAIPGARASSVLSGQSLVSAAGKDIGVTLNGMVPGEIRDVSTITDYLTSGHVEDLDANTNGVIIGDGLAHDLSIRKGENLTFSGADGQTHTLTVIGMFHTGRESYDETQAFVNLKRAQALFNRPDRVNSIIVKLADPYQAAAVAARAEKAIGYKSVSWQEQTEDLMTTLAIRNIIMYTVVGAVVVVAAFGIYNVISTIVLEKRRDIAILKSMGFRASDVRAIFVIEGLVLGVAGALAGMVLGALLMTATGRLRFRYPGSTELVPMPVSWHWSQFAIAAGFAIGAALTAAYLPARRGASVDPAVILRGS